MTRLSGSAADLDGKGLRIAIVCARFNDHIGLELLAGARRGLARSGTTDIVEEWVPGAFEVPLAAKVLAQSGRFDAVVTLGAQGAAWVTASGSGHVPTYEVRVIDTVAAGDAFCGALAASVAAGMDWERSLKRSCAAGALATTVSGASPSLPRSADIDALVDREVP